MTNKRDVNLRRKSVTAEYFISRVNAIAQSGEIVACDRSGSRVGAWPFAAVHLLLVSGANKIVPTLEQALRRVRDMLTLSKMPAQRGHTQSRARSQN